MEKFENYIQRCDSGENDYKFGLHLGKRFCQIFKIIFRERLCIVLFCLIGLISLLEQYVVYQIGIIPSGFYKVFGNQDKNGFVYHTIESFLMILGIAFILSSKSYIVNVLYVFIRQILTREIQFLYFQKNNYYYINALGYKLTDNPDQRITQDVDKFSNKISAMISPLIIAPFTISYYSYICFSTTSWVGPVAVLSVFVISALINKLLIKPVMKLVINQEKCEGFFRFKHMHVRTNAESIALQGAGKVELLRSDEHFTNLVSTQQTLFLNQYPLDMSVKLFDYIGSIVSYLILAAPIFSGKYGNMSAGDIAALVSQNAFVTIYLISCFSSLVDLSSSISHVAGLTYRVSELLTLIQNNNENKQPKTLNEAKFEDTSLPLIEIKNVTFGSPSRQSPLVIGLNLTITFGTNIFITGHSSSGKTSLIRIIHGLWPVWDGTVKRNISFTPSNIFFLSQKALLTDGPLLQQIIYPLHYTRLTNDDELLIMDYIEYVGLEHVLSKAGGLKVPVSWNWNDILSPGEAQRLCFVRLFFHKPRLAFLDESTSAVAMEMEEKLYEKLKELNITLVSVGHRTSLKKYHDILLHLDGTGNWTLSKL